MKDLNIRPGNMPFRKTKTNKNSKETILIALIFGIGTGYLLGLLHASCW